VKALQVMLFLWGYNSEIVVDGVYGPETTAGVNRLQENLGVSVDGNFGPDTRAAVNKTFNFDVDTILTSLAPA
jgi:peptidoglycan hydrolase-like protein with peptidoglycan-binding domain